MRHSKSESWMLLVFLTCICLAIAAPVKAEGKKSFRLVNVLVGKTKMWLPSSISVQAGDEVEIALNNTLSAPHGFKLAQAGIEVEVPSLRNKTVKFTAPQAGIYDFQCHMHAAHIGGQLVVLKE